jgi:hypothetical protein
LIGGAQSTFVVEYPCDKYCRIELELSGERGQTTVQQLRDKAEELHRREHAPESGEAEATPAAEPEPAGRAAPTVFLSAPGRGVDRRR